MKRLIKTNCAWYRIINVTDDTIIHETPLTVADWETIGRNDRRRYTWACFKPGIISGLPTDKYTIILDTRLTRKMYGISEAR